MSSLRQQRKEQRHGEIREEILAAARRVVLDRGLGGFTLAAVARQLQMTKAALYYYFDAKETLVFQLVYGDMARHAEAVGRAVEATESGPAALEALIRVAAADYREHRDGLRLAYMLPQTGQASVPSFSPEMFARIRPFNDRMFGGVATRIAADQEAGRIARSIGGRRLAFVAHNAVIGTLTLEGLVEVAHDAPLMHDHDAMIDEIVAAFTARLAAPS